MKTLRMTVLIYNVKKRWSGKTSFRSLL